MINLLYYLIVGHPIFLICLLFIMCEHECIWIKLFIDTIIWILWHIIIILVKELLHWQFVNYIWVVTVDIIIVRVHMV